MSAVDDATCAFAYSEELSSKEYVIATYYLEADPGVDIVVEGCLLCRGTERGYLDAGAGCHA